MQLVDASRCCWLLLSLFTTASTMPLQASRSTTQQVIESFCRDDYLVAVNEDLPISNETRLLSSVKDSLRIIGFTKRQVTRHELFRFEEFDVNNDQWIIRTWDGNHLAIDDDGRLIVKSGCVTTTFLRFVSPDNLLSCFEGISCKMMLCGTSLSTGRSFIVKRDSQGVALPSAQCKSHKTFRESETLKNLQKSGDDVISIINFLIANSDNVKSMLTNGLRRMCPRAFDPKAEVANNQCVASTSQ